MYTDLHVKYPLFLSDFKVTCIIAKNPQVSKCVQWEPSYFMQTDRRTDGRTGRHTDPYNMLTL